MKTVCVWHKTLIRIILTFVNALAIPVWRFCGCLYLYDVSVVAYSCMTFLSLPIPVWRFCGCLYLYDVYVVAYTCIKFFCMCVVVSLVIRRTTKQANLFTELVLFILPARVLSRTPCSPGMVLWTQKWGSLFGGSRAVRGCTLKV